MKKMSPEVESLVKAVQDLIPQIQTLGGAMPAALPDVTSALKPFTPPDPKSYTLPTWKEFLESQGVKPAKVAGMTVHAFESAEGDRMVITKHFWDALRHITRKVS